MDIVITRCAGLDFHRATVVATVRVPADEGRRRVVTETFGTTTKELLRLSEWLQQHGCTHVLMEATGIYWEPSWHLLCATFEVVVANASHVKAVPGRKTDVCDAEWLADLLAHGLVRPSFVPPAPIPVVVALVGQDSEEPGPELRGILAPAERLIRADERFLHGIRRLVGIAHQRSGVASELHSIPLDQHAGQLDLAVQDSPDDFAVGPTVGLTQETPLRRALNGLI